MNTVNLIGRLTADPELRNTNGGTPVCTVRLAVNRPRKDGKDQGAVFIDVVSFSRQAEAVAEHLGKGRQIAVTGRLEYREWTTDEVRHSLHEVIAQDVTFLDAPPKAPTVTDADADFDEPF